MLPPFLAGLRSVRHRRVTGIERIAAAILLTGCLAGVSGTSLAANLLLHRNGQECAPGVPRCQPIRSDLLTVRPHQVVTLQLKCPASAPAFWNWAADVSRHTDVLLREPIVGKAGQEIGGTFEIRQQDGAGPGQARIHLGCSAKRPSVAQPISYRNRAFGWHPHQ